MLPGVSIYLQLEYVMHLRLCCLDASLNLASKDHLLVLHVAETKCLPPAKVIGSVVTIGGLMVGSKVTYKALSTYSHVGGDLERTCREDELWSGELPVFEGSVQ